MLDNNFIDKNNSIEEVAIIFRNSGIDAFDWYEGEEGPVHMIRFHAGEEEGFKAVDVAIGMGLWPIELRRVWYYRYGSENYPEWELIFNYPPAKGEFDEDSLSLIIESLSYTPLYRSI